MEQFPPIIMNGAQLTALYLCPALAITYSWLRGGRAMRGLSIAGGVGGAIGGMLLFAFERLTLPTPWWDSALHVLGTVITGGLLGVAVAVAGFVVRRRHDL